MSKELFLKCIVIKSSVFLSVSPFVADITHQTIKLGVSKRATSFFKLPCEKSLLPTSALSAGRRYLFIYLLKSMALCTVRHHFHGKSRSGIIEALATCMDLP